ncbi:unnamed protein product [Polarella glacialis]|uniref:Uncharacterized protein n=1 Tax=Polarella glacialis TaxID=89957 RepID=A0A813FUY8_POLGL|nr:unnamed protein product [Polarella glacialis]
MQKTWQPQESRSANPNLDGQTSCSRGPPQKPAFPLLWRSNFTQRRRDRLQQGRVQQQDDEVRSHKGPSIPAAASAVAPSSSAMGSTSTSTTTSTNSKMGKYTKQEWNDWNKKQKSEEAAAAAAIAAAAAPPGPRNPLVLRCDTTSSIPFSKASPAARPYNAQEAGDEVEEEAANRLVPTVYPPSYGKGGGEGGER